MALVACPACAKQVSQLASSCPNCGHPIAGDTASSPRAPVDAFSEVPLSAPGPVAVDSDLTDIRKPARAAPAEAMSTAKFTVMFAAFCFLALVILFFGSRLLGPWNAAQPNEQPAKPQEEPRPAEKVDPEPRKLATFDLTEEEAHASGKDGRYAFKPAAANAELTVVLSLSDPYPIPSNAPAPKFGIKVMRDDLTVATASKVAELRGAEFHNDGALRHLYDEDHVSAKFVPGDTQNYRLVVDAVKGFKKYRITVLSRPAG